MESGCVGGVSRNGRKDNMLTKHCSTVTKRTRLIDSSAAGADPKKRSEQGIPDARSSPDEEGEKTEEDLDGEVWPGPRPRLGAKIGWAWYNHPS